MQKSFSDSVMWLFIAVQTTQCNVALHHSTDNTMQSGSSSQYRQHHKMWLFVTVQATQRNVALHRHTNNTMQCACGSSSLCRQHTAMWPFIVVQTTQCNVSIHQCPTTHFRGPYLYSNAMYLYVNANHSMHSSPFPQPPGILVPASTSSSSETT